MDTMPISAIRAVMEVDRVTNELHDLIRKMRRHLIDPAYRLTPSEIEQTEQRIAELGGRQGWLRYKRLADGREGTRDALTQIDSALPRQQIRRSVRET
jgi:hypothetical protein